ncbi:hypothetical protein [Actinophytocola sp. NPDC049390]|uniref:hypothetical protein n=1 Tax=Actinophytocola sp. NPDC049390 TaxID=3363894 RepID=UPI0037BC07F7
MPKMFANTICVFGCQRPSSPKGEHVWPYWVLEMFTDSDGPCRVEINGQPVLKRDGRVRQYTSITKVRMPCCEECNRELNRRFEQHPRLVIQKMLDADGGVVLGSEEAELFGLWWLKTMLLLSHPDTKETAVGVNPNRWDLAEVPDDLYSWMVTGEPPPSGLSVWFSRQSTAGCREESKPVEICLPTVIADGRRATFMARQAGLKFCAATLVYHPGWPIEYPPEASSGAAVRIWPPSETNLDLTSLRELDRWPVRWVPGPVLNFMDGAYGSVSLPPLQNLLRVETVPGVLFAAAPGF